MNHEGERQQGASEQLLQIEPSPDWKGAERVAVVGELVEPPAMEPEAEPWKAGNTKNCGTA